MSDLDQLRADMKHKFDNIKWNHHPCGCGSLFENTKVTRIMLSNIAKKYDIKTVADAGAGDLSWVHEVDWDVEYTPYDIRKWDPRIIEFDITKDVLPKADLIVCRHVLNHLDSSELLREVMKRFSESECKYIFITYRKDVYSQFWGSILETQRQNFPNNKYWNYGLWQIN